MKISKNNLTVTNNTSSTTILVALYFMLKPIYLWSSGTLQIADFVLLLGILFMQFSDLGFIRLRRENISIVLLILSVIIFQVIVNTCWYMIYDELAFLKSSLYYIFNFLSFVFVIRTGEKSSVDQLKNAISKGSFVSILITVAGLILISGPTRKTGFFNNPNQLGYYAVIMLTILLYCQEYFDWKQKTIMLLGSFWSIIASLSKAAIIGAFGLLFVYIAFYQKKATLKKVVLQLFLLGLVLTLFFFLFYSDSSIVANNRTLYLMRYRILHMMAENDSSLGEGRGYARVFELGTNFLWGTGEGAYYRFRVKTNAEIHSTFVSILVSYGAIGFIGYLIIMAKCIMHKGRWVRNITLLSGLLLYSITHNGIRNTLFWMLLATLYLDNDKEIPSTQKSNALTMTR